jgi:hypothetical protein
LLQKHLADARRNFGTESGSARRTDKSTDNTQPQYVPDSAVQRNSFFSVLPPASQCALMQLQLSFWDTSQGPSGRDVSRALRLLQCHEFRGFCKIWKGMDEIVAMFETIVRNGTSISLSS